MFSTVLTVDQITIWNVKRTAQHNHKWISNSAVPLSSMELLNIFDHVWDLSQVTLLFGSISAHSSTSFPSAASSCFQWKGTVHYLLSMKQQTVSFQLMNIVVFCLSVICQECVHPRKTFFFFFWSPLCWQPHCITRLAPSKWMRGLWFSHRAQVTLNVNFHVLGGQKHNLKWMLWISVALCLLVCGQTLITSWLMQQNMPHCLIHPWKISWFKLDRERANQQRSTWTIVAILDTWHLDPILETHFGW